jgi:undecaprenyl-diphosphatase
VEASTIVEALILGVVEGVTEFIPVSSTAHLLLAGRLLGFENAGKAFEVLIQLGAILALLAVYFGRLVHIAKTLRSRRTQRFVLGVLVAFLPSAILGVLLYSLIKVMFESVMLISIMLIVGGIVLLFVDRLPVKPRYHEVMDYSMPAFLGIGLFQCLSLIPGVSRSGATIVGALLLGTDKRSAADFSFFLAMPTMAGAFVYDLYKNIDSIDVGGAAVIAIGFIAAFFSALVVVRGFLGFVSRHGFALFGWWRIAVGVVGLAAVLYFGNGSSETTVAGSNGPARVELAARPEALQIGRQDGGERRRLDAESFQRPMLADRRL